MLAVETCSTIRADGFPVKTTNAGRGPRPAKEWHVLSKVIQTGWSEMSPKKTLLRADLKECHANLVTIPPRPNHYRHAAGLATYRVEQATTVRPRHPC